MEDICFYCDERSHGWQTKSLCCLKWHRVMMIASTVKLIAQLFLVLLSPQRIRGNCRRLKNQTDMLIRQNYRSNCELRETRWLSRGNCDYFAWTSRMDFGVSGGTVERKPTTSFSLCLIQARFLFASKKKIKCEAEIILIALIFELRNWRRSLQEMSSERICRQCFPNIHRKKVGRRTKKKQFTVEFVCCSNGEMS